MYPKVAKVIVALPVEGPFDYSVTERLQKNIAIGQRVKVMFNRKIIMGMVVGLGDKSDFPKLNPVLDILDRGMPILDADALILSKKMADFFGCSWGEALAIHLPRPLRKTSFFELPHALPVLNIASPSNTILCEPDTVTRWDYLRLKIKSVIDDRKSVLILAPDAFVLKAAVKELKTFKDKLIIFKKPVAVKKDLASWVKATTTSGNIVIGTRSAVFTPINALSLIIMLDEENEAYKEEQPPHYHARSVVLWRSELIKCDTLFVGLSPSVDLWYLAHKNNWNIELSKLTPRPVNLQLVDQSNYKRLYENMISFPLQSEMQKVLKAGGKILLFMNRRGFATVTKCNHCGFTLKCPRCSVNLTYMYSKKKLVCRFCEHKEDVPKICSSCGSDYLRSTGAGVEKFQSSLALFFSTARIGYYDKESEGYPNEYDIVVATQAVLRWKDEVRVDLCAILDIDAEMNRFDHASSHKVFSLLMGLRQMTANTLCVQTHMPGNYVIDCAVKLDWGTFYQQELLQRKEMNFPPYKHFISIGLRGLDEDAILKQSVELYNAFQKIWEGQAIEIFEPQPEMIAKLRDQYRYTIMLRTEDPAPILKDIKSVLKAGKHRRGIVVTLEVV
ncbi:MAG: primosomal protein N' [Candidatus Omnitrophica bacterium]|nr:primosomal protein N' [Candidatus Omnitrophota bacterium]